MKNITLITSLFLSLVLFSCSTENMDSNSVAEENMDSQNTARKSNIISKTWDFNDLNEWQDASQNSSPNYFIENGQLNMFTHANTWERTKIKSVATYGTGTYTWKVFAPEMGVGDMSSIGAFLYYDDKHELDFEIGYGNQAIRQELNAQDDDLVLYMSSQANPSQSVRTTIKRNQSYDLSIELLPGSGNKYFVNWKINGTTMASAQLNYGGSTKFRIFCSMENLQFMGDHIPQNQNHALFDQVQYTSF